MTNPSPTIETPAGAVRATAGPRRADAVLLELAPERCAAGRHRNPPLQPVHRRTRLPRTPQHLPTTAPDDTLPRLASSRTGYRGSLTLYRYAHRPGASVNPWSPPPDTSRPRRRPATLTAVLRACADHIAQPPSDPQAVHSLGAGPEDRAAPCVSMSTSSRPSSPPTPTTPTTHPCSKAPPARVGPNRRRHRWRSGPRRRLPARRPLLQRPVQTCGPSTNCTRSSIGDRERSPPLRAW
jgi:hypothetical protein